ncbi:MAG: Maf family protein [Bacillota bacterium]
MKSGQRIILASASPRRRDLLHKIGLEFEIMPAEINEADIKEADPEILVQKLAELKAKNVGAEYESALIIAADTVVAIEEMILGKPTKRSDAEKMLAILSGRKHKVYTGLAIYQKNISTTKFEVAVDVSTVWMRPFDSTERKAYLDTGEPFDKAGSYAIQGYGGLLVEKISGSYFTIMGLPLHKLAELLPQYGINLY